MALTSIAPALAQDIVIDGRTSTSVATSGTTTNIHSQTLSGNLGVNSFVQFNVGQGSQVNIHVPQGATGTLNLVNGARSQINGQLRSMQNGAVGGSLYMANPNGFVVGPTGTISAGSVHLSTPSAQSLAAAIGIDGKPVRSHIDAIVNGTAPLSGGSIDIRGSVSGNSAVTLQAGGDIAISGAISAGDRNALIGSAVNTGGRIRIEAGGDVRLSASGRINAQAGAAGGSAEIRSGGDITVQSGASIRAEGVEGGQGGSVVVFGGKTATLERDAVVSAAALGHGDGGFVEFSADEMVELVGEIDASSRFGRQGSVLIDPDDVVIGSDSYYNGVSWTITADRTITVLPGVEISTRVVTPGDDHATGKSIGDSGDFTLRAPVITLGKEAAIYTHADNGFKGGDILLEAHIEDTTASGASILPVGDTRISATYATLRGRNVTLSARSFKDNLLLSNAQIAGYVDGLLDPLGVSALEAWIGAQAASAVAGTPAAVLRSEIENLYGYLRADARVELLATRIVARNKIDIGADARTNMTITPENQTIAVAAGFTETNALVAIENSQLLALGDIDISANTTEIANMVALSSPAYSNDPAILDNATAVVSGRRSRTEAYVYGFPDIWDPVPGVFEQDRYQGVESGGDISITANSTKNIQLVSGAVTNSEAQATSVVVSMEDSVTRAGVGADLIARQGDLTIDARTHYPNLVTRSLVSATQGPASGTGPAIPAGDLDLIAGALQGMVTALGDLASPGTALPAGAVAVNYSSVKSETGAHFGSFDVPTPDLSGFGPLYDYVPTLNTATFNAYPGSYDFATGVSDTYETTKVPDHITDLNIHAETDFDLVLGETAVRVGDADAANAGAVAIAVDDWDLSTIAEVEGFSTVGFGVNLDLRADTLLPASSIVDLANFRNDAVAYLDMPFDIGLVPLSQLSPTMADLLDDDDFSFLNDVQVGAGELSGVVDVASRSFDIETKALTKPGWFFESSADNTIDIAANVTGGLVARRAPDPNWTDIQSGGSGAGIAIQHMKADLDTQAVLAANWNIESQSVDGPLPLKSINVLALNSAVVGVNATSFGSNGGISADAGIAVLDYDAETRALMDELIQVNVLGATTIAASDFSVALAEALSGGDAGGSVAIGYAQAQVNANRDVLALFTGLDDDLDPVSPVVLPDDLYQYPFDPVFRELTVASLYRGMSVVSSSSGATSRDEAGLAAGADVPDFAALEDDAGTAATNGEGAASGQAFGLNLSTDYARLNETVTTEARIDALRTVKVNALDVSAANEGLALVGAGAGVANASTVGMGAAFSSFLTDRRTEAAVRGGIWQGITDILSGVPTVSVTAEDSMVARSLASGRGGSTRGVSLLGSIAKITGDADTEAEMSIDLSGVESVTVSAERLGADIASAGAIAKGASGDDVSDTPAQKGVFALGVSYASNAVDETTSAMVNAGGLSAVAVDGPEGPVSLAPGLRGIGTLDVTARNDGLDWLTATSDGAGASLGVAGSAIRQITDHDTQAGISGLVISGDGDITVTADDTARVRAIISAENEAEKAGAGGSVIVTEDDRETAASLENSIIAGSAAFGAEPDVVVASTMAGRVDLFQKAGATSDGGIAGDISAGFLTTDWDTEATVSGGDFDDIADLRITATETGRLSNIQAGLSDAGKGAGTLGFAKTAYGSDVTAELKDSEIFVARETVEVSAASAATYRTRAVRSGSSDAASGAGIFASVSANGETRAEIADSTVWADRIDVSASDEAWRENVASATATADAVGIVGGLTLDRYRRDTVALVDGTNLDAGIGGIDVSALSDTRSTNIVIGRANGGASVGVAAQLSWLKDDRDVTAEILGGSIVSDGDVDVEARRDDVALLLQGTEASATTGVGIGAGVILTGGQTTARIDQPSSVWIDGDTSVLATDASRYFGVGIGAGSAGAFSAIGSFTDMRLGKLSALSVAVAESERGDAEDSAATGARADLAAILAANDPDASSINLTRLQEVRAEINIGSGTANFDGDLDITALDDRQAHAITGQIQAAIIESAGTVVDRFFEVESLNTDGFTIAIRPFAPASEEDDSEETADLGSEDAEGVEEFTEAGADNPGGSSGGVNIGGAISRVTAGGAVIARLDVASGATVEVDGEASVEATNRAGIHGLAMGAQVGSGVGLSASAAITRAEQYVLSSVEGGGQLNADDLLIGARSNGKAMSVAGLVSLSSGQFAGGASVAVSNLNAQTGARIVDTGVRIVGGSGDNSLDVQARDRSQSLATALAGGGASNAGFGTVAYSGSRSITEAYALRSHLIVDQGSANFSTIVGQSVTALGLQGSFGSTVAAGASIASAAMDGAARTRLEDVNLFADEDVIVSAAGEGTISASAFGAALGGTAGISGSISTLSKSDEILAEIEDSVASAGDSLLIEAVNGTGFTSLGGGDESLLGTMESGAVSVAAGGTVGVGASVSVIKSQSSVIARAVGETPLAAGFSAVSPDGVASLGRSFLDYTNPVETTYDGIAIIADNATDIRAMAASIAAAGTVSVAMQVPLVFVEDEVSAAFIGDPAGASAIANTDINIAAANSSTVKTFSLVGSGAGTVGGGGDIEFLSLSGSAEALVDDAYVEAFQDLTISAVSADTLDTVSLLGAGGGTVGLAGVVQVARSDTRTHTSVSGSTLVAGGTALVNALNVRDINQDSVSLSLGGLVGLGGTVFVLKAEDEVTAEIADDTAPSGASSISAGGAVRIDATAISDIDQTLLGVAAGGAGIGATILVASYEQDVAARLGDGASVLAGTGSLGIHATQSFASDTQLGVITGGGMGFGATVGVISMSNSVLAEVGDGASVDVSGDITVAAHGERSFDGWVATGGGGVFSLQAAVLSLTFGKASETGEADEHLGRVNDSLEDGNAYDGEGDLSNGDKTIAGLIGDAEDSRKGFNILDLTDPSFAPADTIAASIGASASLVAGDDIAVTATEAGEVSALAGGASLGAVSAAGGMAFVRRGSALNIDIGAAAVLTAADDLNIEADAAVDLSDERNPVEAIAASVGLISGIGAVADVRTARTMTIAIGEDAALTSGDSGETLIRIGEDAATKAKTLGISVSGLGAFGATVSTARHESELVIEFADSGAVRPTIRGGDVTIEVDRSGEVDARATGVSGGLAVAGVAVDANAIDSALAEIRLGRADIDVNDNDIAITARNDADIYASSTGVAVGGAALGLAFSKAERLSETKVNSGSGASTRLEGRDIEVLAIDTAGESSFADIEAKSVSGSGGAYGVGGGESRAINMSEVKTDLRLFELDAGRDVRIAAVSRGRVDANSTGLTGGLYAAGANLSVVTSETDAEVSLDIRNTDTEILGDLTVEALGAEELTANVVSGQGAVIAAQAAKSVITSESSTNVTIEGVEGQDYSLTADDFFIRAEREVDVTNQGDSFQASLAGYGGTRLDTTVNGDLGITVKNISLYGEDFLFESEADFDKASPGFDGRIGSVGALSGTSLKSTTLFDADTTFIFDHALVEQRDGGENEGIDILVDNRFDVDDDLKIDTGGGIAIPNAKSEIDVNNDVVITIDNSTLESDGTLSLLAVADTDLHNEVYVNVYGLAGSPSGDALSDFDGAVTVDVTGASALRSRGGDVTLRAGSAPGDGQETDLYSEIRVWNATAIPITRKPSAVADVSQSNQVNIGTFGELLAARNVVIETGEGSVDAYALSASSDLYREGAAAVVNAFGSLVGADDVSFDSIGGTESVVFSGDITIDGRVASGAYGQLVLRVGPSGEVLPGSTGDVEVEFADDVDLAGTFASYIAELETEAAAYPDDAALQARVESEVNRLNALIAQMGGGGTADMIIIDDLTASGGNIDLIGTSVAGSGTVESNTEIVIEVINESARVVEVRDVLIPFDRDGFIRYNGIEVGSSADINEINDANATEFVLGIPLPLEGPDADLTLITATTSPVEPRVNIQNLYTGGSGGGDILVTGDIENLGGSVNLFTADGDILVLGGTIDANTVDITSNGNFFLSAALSQLVTGVPADGLGPYSLFFEAYSDWVDQGSNPADEPEFAIASGGEITATKGAFIYANTLNINGTIRSGVTDWDLTIDRGLATYLEGLDFAGTQPQVIYNPGVNTGFAGDLYITGNGVVRWDPVEKQLIVDPMHTQGGFVELVGKIVSTGEGRIEAADGYGRINVDSEFTLPVVFNGLSTGYDDGADGVIRIVDLNIPGALADTFVTTTYTHNGDDEIEKTVDLGNGIKVTTSGAAGAAGSYSIAGAWALDYEVDRYREFDVVEERTIDVGGTVSNPYIVSSSVLPNGGYSGDVEVAARLSTEAALSATPYAFSRSPGSGAQEGDYEVVSDWTVDHAVGTTIYQRRTLRGTFQSETDTHSIAANHDIAIDFTGYDTSELRVASEGDVILGGPVYNRHGVTVIESVEGDLVAASADVVLETGLTFLGAGGSIGRRAGPLTAGRDGVAAAGGGLFGGGTANGGLLVGNLVRTLGPLRIDQEAGRGLEASAGGDIRIAEQTGDMNLRYLYSENGKVVLSTPGSILVSDYTNVPTGESIITGDELDLTASGGSIGTVLAPMRTDTKLVTAHAFGDINLYQTGDRSLAIDQVASTGGNVSIVVPIGIGNITDGNISEKIDRRAEAGDLDSLWDDLGLRVSADIGQLRRVQSVDRFEAEKNADYEFYWRTRGVNFAAGETVLSVEGTQAYDPGLVISFGAEQRAALSEQGMTETEINAEEARQTDRYHALHALYGAGGYDPGFGYAANTAETADVTELVYWNDRQLGLGLRTDLVLEAGDSDPVIEDANIIGVNVNLIAAGSIGSRQDDLLISEGDLLDDNALQILMAAEQADITVTGDTARVRQLSDLDILATGTLTAIAGRDVLIGSEAAITIGLVDAGSDFENAIAADPDDYGNIRIKSSDALFGLPNLLGLPNVSGRHLVLEGGAGGIGEPLAPVTIDQQPGGSVVARGEGTVNLLAPTSNIAVAEIFSGEAVNITALDGAIYDDNGGSETDLVAAQATLLALGDIGTKNNPLDIELRQSGGLLTAISTEGQVSLTVPDGDINVARISAVADTVTLEIANGDMILQQVGGITPIEARTLVDISMLSGDIVSAPGLDFDIEADALTIVSAGNTGTALNPLVTRLGRIDYVGSGIRGDRAAYIGNENRFPPNGLDIGTIQFTGADQRLFRLLNEGDITLNAQSLLQAGEISLITLGEIDDIEIEATPTAFAGAVSLIARDDLIIEDGVTVSWTDSLTVNAARVSSGPLVVSTLSGEDLSIASRFGIELGSITGGDVALSVSEVGKITTGSIIAGTLTASTNFGDGQFGDVIAATVDADIFGTVTGSFDVSGALDIFAGSTIGMFLSDYAPDHALVVTGTADNYHFAGEFGVNVAFTGTGGSATMTAETAMRGDGTLRSADGTLVLDLADSGFGDVGKEAGIFAQSTARSLTIGEAGIRSNGAKTDITALTMAIDGDIDTGGGELLLSNVLGTAVVGVTVTGDLLSGGGDVTIRSDSYRQIGDLLSTGGDVLIESNGPVDSHFLRVEGDILTGSGALTLRTTGNGILEQIGGSVIDAGGPVLISGANRMSLAQVKSGHAGTDPAITIETDEGVTVSGLGPHLVADNGAISFSAASLALSGVDALRVQAERVDIEVDSGDLPVKAIDAVSVGRFGTGSGLAQIFAVGGLDLSGSIIFGDTAVLTSTGAISESGGGAPVLLAGETYLTALGGGIGSAAKPFNLITDKTSRINSTAFGDINLSNSKGGLDLGIIMAAGDVTLSADTLVIADMRAAQVPDYNAATVSVLKDTRSGTFTTNPAVTGLIEKAAYVPLTLGVVPPAGGNTSTPGTGTPGTGTPDTGNPDDGTSGGGGFLGGGGSGTTDPDSGGSTDDGSGGATGNPGTGFLGGGGTTGGSGGGFGNATGGISFFGGGFSSGQAGGASLFGSAFGGTRVNLGNNSGVTSDAGAETGDDEEEEEQEE